MPFLCLSPSTQQIQQSKFAFFFFRSNLTVARQTKNCYYQKGTHTHTHTHQHRSLAVVKLVVEAPFCSLGAQLAPTSDERPGYRRWWAKKKRERVRVQFEKTTVPAHWQSTVVVVDSVVEPIGKQSSTEHTHGHSVPQWALGWLGSYTTAEQKEKMQRQQANIQREDKPRQASFSNIYVNNGNGL